MTRRAESARVEGLDTVLELQKAIYDIEKKLGISERWTPTSPGWIEAEKNLAEQTYRKALDQLEGLVVSRLFELSKMNRAGTCMYSFICAKFIIHGIRQATDKEHTSRKR